MKRLTFAIALLVAMAIAAPATAHHRASRATKTAILKSFKFPGGPVNNGSDCTTRALRCWRVLISGSWATARDIGPGNNGAGEWLYIDHRQHHHWRYVGGEGEGTIFACQEKGLPSRVARDLKIFCK